MITLEIYELGRADELLAYIADAAVVPRVDERLYLKRVDKIVGKNPDAEHPYFRVVHVEHHYDVSREDHNELSLKYGRHTQVAVLVKREVESLWE